MFNEVDLLCNLQEQACEAKAAQQSGDERHRASVQKSSEDAPKPRAGASGSSRGGGEGGASGTTNPSRLSLGP